MSTIEHGSLGTIDDGVCRIFFAFDVGHSIDLDAALRRVTSDVAAGPDVLRARRAQNYLQFEPPPLRISLSGPAVPIGGAPAAGGTAAHASFASEPLAEATLFDFGAVSVSYRIPLAGRTPQEWLALAAELYECPALRADALKRLEALLPRLAPAISRPHVSHIVEDFIVYRIQPGRGDAGNPGGLLSQRGLLAQILRGEPQPLSDAECDEALAFRMSYARDDLTIIDWNAALVLDRHADDTLAVLEFANVELLEMRFLDDRLDRVLDRFYQSMSVRPLRAWLGSSREERRALAGMQLDSALLFEGINNAIKLVGDQYLARLYRLAARRFHLADWDASVLRKLDIVQRLYEKVSDEQAARRLEILEWIIIVLIAVSIVVPFLPWVQTH